MPDMTLGKITFTIEDGELFIRNQWNPRSITRKERDQISKTLREVADNLDVDMFETDGEYVFYKSPAEKE